MIRIAIILGSTRPGRRVVDVARWVAEAAGRHPAAVAGEASLELVDIADYELPMLDEPAPAATGYGYLNAHTKRWAATIDRFDGFVFVTPEYNSAIPAALKNAIDYLYAEWNDKAAGIVSYGAFGGIRAAEQLRQTMGEIKIADVHAQVAISLYHDFDFSDSPLGAVAPGERHETTLTTMLDEVLAWSRALRVLRTPATADK
ncbi:NADPH-dependent FMN reductase [Kibdelosporangium persicum]|uniref:FMN-dependent NADPH-azoreductase n=1 Tax=Kibdelosporangium persicum TaxID=2698649 RepID=A0ABX2FD94_9PSEU|nr:NAD(P)H-dependent oxidoreductase [Kibdelosporangium persicum]NRN68788.1 FMN-dependent NADPH-azoreductase [Kibdelosporangium persicum]